MTFGDGIRIGFAVLVRPYLWGIALRQAMRLAPVGWWRRPPFLPVPDARYVQMRTTIQYGAENHRVDTADVLKYLAWAKAESSPA